MVQFLQIFSNQQLVCWAKRPRRRRQRTTTKVCCLRNPSSFERKLLSRSFFCTPIFIARPQHKVYQALRPVKVLIYNESQVLFELMAIRFSRFVKQGFCVLVSSVRVVSVAQVLVKRLGRSYGNTLAALRDRGEVYGKTCLSLFNVAASPSTCISFQSYLFYSKCLERKLIKDNVVPTKYYNVHLKDDLLSSERFLIFLTDRRGGGGVVYLTNLGSISPTTWQGKRHFRVNGRLVH